MAETNVPSLDLSSSPTWTSGEPIRGEVIDTFEIQLESYGFLAVRIPGIGRQVDHMYEAVAAAMRNAAGLSRFSHERMPQTLTSNHGYFGYGSEVPTLSGVPDPKEFVHISGAMLDDTPPGAADLLQAFPGLTAASRLLFELGIRLATDVVAALLRAYYSDLEDQSATELVDYESSVLRAIQYRLSGEPQVLAGTHTGIQTLGVQFPPSSGGLEYLNRAGDWVEPELCGTDIVICNIGRSLSYVTTGRLAASPHRVRSVRPDHSLRHSAVLFVHPRHEGRAWKFDSDERDESEVRWGELLFNPKSALRRSHRLI